MPISEQLFTYSSPNLTLPNLFTLEYCWTPMTCHHYRIIQCPAKEHQMAGHTLRSPQPPPSPPPGALTTQATIGLISHSKPLSDNFWKDNDNFEKDNSMFAFLILWLTYSSCLSRLLGFRTILCGWNTCGSRWRVWQEQKNCAQGTSGGYSESMFTSGRCTPARGCWRTRPLSSCGLRRFPTSRLAATP